jgi:hypothetical protein
MTTLLGFAPGRQVLLLALLLLDRTVRNPAAFDALVVVRRFSPLLAQLLVWTFSRVRLIRRRGLQRR